MTRSETIGAAAAAALLLVAPSATLAQDDLARFEGEYTFAGGEPQEEELEEAIERVTDRMGMFVRGIANRQIRENVQVEERVALEVDGEHVRLVLDDWRSVPIPLGGAPVRGTGPDGRPGTLRATLEGQRLAIVQQSDRGTRENWFSLARGGSYLYMQVRVSSDQLPEPIRYTLTYRRAGAPSSVASR